MRYQSRARRPETGMELSVTLSLAADQTVEKSAESIVKFMEAVQTASASVGAVWIHMRCSGIPHELEGRMQAAIDAAKKPAHLTVVVDNTGTLTMADRQRTLAEELAAEEELARRRFVHHTRPNGPLSLDEARKLCERLEGTDDRRRTC